MAFPQKGPFSAEMELAGKISRPLVAFVQAGNKICWEAPLHEPPLYRVAR
jgi:hypothetical protein